MSDNYEKEVQEFAERFESGKTKVEFLTNNGLDYSTKEERDTVAFMEYLKSENSKSLANEVFGNAKNIS
jgi:squalene cyclase